MDKYTKDQRRKNMQAVKSKDSQIELSLRKALWQKGYRYRKNYKELIGKPDIVLTKFNIAIFCDSEFWHGYDWGNKKLEIKSNRQFWINKIESNMNRDVEVTAKLKEQGWYVLRFWGKQIKKDLPVCIKMIEDAIKEKQNEVL